ncbi:MAG: 4Fe-4S binding protein [Verrucomicrobia bacterium]|nr:4Fe-4S binding protein [Verrucomicrobiota bacterium]
MKRLSLLAICLLLAWWQVLPAEEAADPPPCFKIPSAEDISSNEGIATYREQYCPQQFLPESDGWIVADLAMLTAILSVGGVMVWRHVHFSRLGIPAGLALLYFGFIRGGCICPVGSVANLARGLRHPELIGRSTAAMFFLPLVVALGMGRVFCVAGCPLGAMQHLLGGRRSRPIPAARRRGLEVLPVVALIATAWLALRGTCFLVCLLDPYKTAFFLGCGWIQRVVHLVRGGLVEPGMLLVGDLTAWGILVFAVGLGRWVYRPFCRFVCPYGVLLGWLSMVALRRRHIEQSQCVQCGICEKQCPVQAISRDPQTKDFRISAYHCIQCNRCSSLCRKSGIRGR